MALVFTHPDLLSLIAGYALSQTRDMIALNVVSKEFSVVTSLHSEAIFEFRKPAVPNSPKKCCLAKINDGRRPLSQRLGERF